jgi:predicted transcriptional regulator
MSKTIKIGIATVPEMRARTLAVVAGTRKVLPGEPKVWFPSISDATRVVSDENMALLRVLREQQPESVDALALAVGKPVTEVAASLQTMANFSLVKLNRKEGIVVPVAACDHVTIEFNVN